MLCSTKQATTCRSELPLVAIATHPALKKEEEGAKPPSLNCNRCSNTVDVGLNPTSTQWRPAAINEAASSQQLTLASPSWCNHAMRFESPPSTIPHIGVLMFCSFFLSILWRCPSMTPCIVKSAAAASLQSHLLRVRGDLARAAVHDGPAQGQAATIDVPYEQHHVGVRPEREAQAVAVHLRVSLQLRVAVPKLPDAGPQALRKTSVTCEAAPIISARGRGRRGTRQAFLRMSRLDLQAQTPEAGLLSLHHGNCWIFANHPHLACSVLCVCHVHERDPPLQLLALTVDDQHLIFVSHAVCT